MKKTETLKKNYEFKRVLTKGKYFTGNYIEIFLIKNNTNTNKIGIAIGVKLAKATKRNRIKRLIRENYRLLELENKLQYGYTIVFLWKKKQKVQLATFSNIKEDMEKILKKTGILK